MAHRVTRSGFPVNPELRRLQDHFGILATAWREPYSQPDRQAAIVQAYRATLADLSQHGWDPDVANLEHEETFPDNLLPEAYHRHRTAPVPVGE